MRKISQKSDDKWNFRCYDSGNNRGGFHAWYDRQTPEIAAAIDSALLVLRGTARWADPIFKELHGACKGLSEIRLEIPKEQSDQDDATASVRILGFVGPGKNNYTMLRGFIKVDGTEYSAECPRAASHMEIVRKHGERAPNFEN